MPNPEFRKTVLIGLGGAGQLMVLSLKRLFMDAFGVVPPSIKLLSLDTDSSDISVQSITTGKTYTFDPNEFLHMEVSQPQEFIESGGAVGDWFVKPIPVGAITNGAGAVREVGRLALFFHINDIQIRIDRIVTSLNDNRLPMLMQNAQRELGASTNFRLSEKKPEIYICGSLAGGTGSGTFLDMGILMRHVMPEAIIQGFFLLGWPYRHKAFANRVPGNVYAALCELDNLQSIMYGMPGFVPYSVEYGKQKVEVRQSPYSLFNLIDGRNQEGENIDNVNDLCDTLATAIFLSAGEMGEQVSSVIDNLLKLIHVPNPTIWKKKVAGYSSLGVSSIYYPAPELHRCVAMANALKLCREALSEAKLEQTGDMRGADRSEAIDREIDILINHLTLTRSYVQTKVCPFNGDLAFEVEKFEMADPGLLPGKLQGEQKALETALQKAFENHGRSFISSSLEVVQEKLSELERDDTKDTRYRVNWINQFCDRIQAWDQEASEEITEKLTEIDQQKKATENLFDIVTKSRYIPMLGGARKSAAAKWSESVLNLLKVIKKTKTLECERKFYDGVLRKLQEKRPAVTPGASEVEQALDATERSLRSAVAGAENTIKRLRAKRTQILLGNGNIVAIRGENDRRQDESIMIDKIFVSYTSFKEDMGIKTAEHYLKVCQEGPEKLVSLFSDYCLKKLGYLTDFSVIQAMETFGKHDPEGYMEEQVKHLFRLSSPLWSYQSGKMNAVQNLRYDNILSVGIERSEEGQEQLRKIVDRIRASYSIKSDHTFSLTNDKYRIWLLNYAAALPLYLMNGLQQTKKQYEEEITPTYHIDKYFEMNAPDLFPVDDEENVALRVLGMAIVPGIDVVRDEYLRPKGGRGHKFTCDAEPVEELTYGEPMVWYLFREMYEGVHRDPTLLKILTAELAKKINSMDKEEVRTKIKAHVDKLQTRLATRDFNRLISARLTYREVKELEQFLSPRGYAMDIDRYIGGQ
jgi:DNA-directed RNA polymerase subunit F